MRNLFLAHTGAHLEIAYTMADEDVALRNALSKNFPNALQLSCYFHLLKLLRTHYKNRPGYGEAMTFLRDCHYTTSPENYENVYNEFMRKNSTKVVKYDPDDNPNHTYSDYKPIIDYIIQKLANTSLAKNFQMFLTPPGTSLLMKGMRQRTTL